MLQVKTTVGSLVDNNQLKCQKPQEWYTNEQETKALGIFKKLTLETSKVHDHLPFKPKFMHKPISVFDGLYALG